MNCIRLLGKSIYVESLSFTGCKLTDTSMNALATGFSKLKHLSINFGCNDMTDTGIRALTQAPFVSSLESIDFKFRSEEITSVVFGKSLASFPKLSSITVGGGDTHSLDDEVDQHILHLFVYIFFLQIVYPM